MSEQDEEELVNSIHDRVTNELLNNDYYGFISKGSKPKTDKPGINESKAFTRWFIERDIKFYPSNLSKDHCIKKINDSIVDGANDKDVDSVFFDKSTNPINVYIVQAKFYSYRDKITKDIIEEMKSFCEKIHDNTDRMNKVNKKVAPKLEHIYEYKKYGTPIKIHFYLLTTSVLNGPAEQEWTSLEKYVGTINDNNFSITLIKADAHYLKENIFDADDLMDAMVRDLSR